MKIKFCFVCAFLLFVFICLSSNLLCNDQSENILNKLEKIKQNKNYLNDSNYYKTLELLVNKYEYLIVDSAMIFVNEIQVASKITNNEFHKMLSLYLNANVLQNNENNYLALENYYKAYTIAMDQKNINYCMKITRRISFSFEFIGDFNKALEFQIYCYNYAKILNNKEALAAVYTNLGNCFDNVGLPAKSLEYNYYTLNANIEMGEKQKIANTLNNLAITYIRIKDLNKAMKLLKQVYDIKLTMPNNDVDLALSNTCANIGVLYLELNQADSALKYLNQGMLFFNLDKNSFKFYNIKNYIIEAYIQNMQLDIAQKSLDSIKFILNYKKNVENDYNKLLLYSNYSSLYLKKNMIAKSIEYGKRAFQIGNTDLFKEERDVVSKILYKAYKKSNNRSEALKYLEMIKEQEASIDYYKNNFEIGKLEAKYQYDKDKKAFILNQSLKTKIITKKIETQYNIILIVVSCLLLLLAMLIVILKTLRKIKSINLLLNESNKQKEMQLEEINSQNIEISFQNQEILNQKEELILLNDLKDKFVSIVAHDLRSHFAGFLGMLEILVKFPDKFSKEEMTSKIIKLEKSAQNVYKLLESLLELSMHYRGLKKFETQVYNITNIINQNIELLANTSNKKNIEITLNSNHDYQVLADLSFINSILRNLMTNAIKFTPQNGKVNINVDNYDKDSVLICIADTGVGIPEKSLENLFKIGKKVSTLGTEGEMSAGLGLIICKEYVEKHNGNIWVESEVGVGSKFFFTIKKYVVNSEI